MDPDSDNSAGDWQLFLVLKKVTLVRLDLSFAIFLALPMWLRKDPGKYLPH